MLHFTLYGIFRYCPLEWILLLVAAPGLAGERGSGIGQSDDCMVYFHHWQFIGFIHGVQV